MIAPFENFVAKSLAVFAFIAATALPATAQTTSEPEPYRNLDEFGVDLSTGTFNFSLQELVGGSANNGIDVTRVWGQSGWKNPYSGHLRQTGSSTVTIVRGTLSEKFSLSGSVWVPAKANGATLTRSANVGFPTYVYTASDGTVITYQAVGTNVFTPEDGYPTKYTVVTDPGGCWFSTPQATGLTAAERCAVPVSIVSPNGARVDLDWLEEGECFQYYNSLSDQGWQCDDRTRLLAISDQIGYKLSYSYTNSTYDYTSSWWQRSGASLTDRSTGNAVSATYSYPSGPVQQITDQFGRTWTFGFASGRMTSITRPGASSATTTISYGTDGKVSSVTRDGVTKTYGWSSSGGSDTVAVAGGSSGGGTITSTTAVGQPGTLVNATSNSTANTYDSNNRITRTTFPEGNYVQYTYDSRGNITNTLFVAKTGSGLADVSTSANFDNICGNAATCNQPNYTIDERGNRTDYAYSSTHGGVTQIQFPAPSAGQPRPQINYTYTALYAQVKNSSGTLINVSTPQYKVTQVTSCAIATTCAGSASETKVTIAYNTPNLQTTSVTIAAGDGSISSTTNYTYDENDNLFSVDGPLSGTSDTTYYYYDASQREVGAIGPDPDDAGSALYPGVRITYDSAGRIAKREHGVASGTSRAAFDAMTVSSSVETTYDANDRKTIEKFKANDGTTMSLAQYSYDSAGRLECAALRMNPTAYGSLPGTACTLGTEGSFGPDRISKAYYDSNGRMMLRESGVGTMSLASDATFTYTANSQLATILDAENNRTTYEYDGYDRVVKTRFPDPTKGSGTSSTTDYEQVVYDAAGNVTSFRTRRNETLTMSYDYLNRLVAKVVPERGGLSSTHTRDVYYGYDLLGNMTYARFDSTSGEGITNAFNALGQLTSTTTNMDSAPRTISYAYDTANNRIQFTYPDYHTVSYLRFNSGAFWLAVGNGSAELFTQTYDTQGRPWGLFRWDTSGTYWYNYTANFSYDAMSRLTGYAHELAGTTNDGWNALTYNPAGQISSMTRSNDLFAWTGSANVNRSYAANGLNQYSAVGGLSFSHDDNGNLASDGINSYVYDVENRLVSSSANGGSTLRYDPLGRLYEVSGSSTGITRFLYDGEDLLAEYNSAGTMLRRYIHGVGVDEPLMQFETDSVSDSARRYFYSDERGSIIAVTDSAGNVLDRIAYDEYGIFSESAPSYTSRFKYTGQAYIPELGMYYYKARMYSPSLGRFMQTDPIGYGDGMNMYAYVHSDPVNGTDPSGLITYVLNKTLQPRRRNDLQPSRRNDRSELATAATSTAGSYDTGGSPQNDEGDDIVVNGKKILDDILDCGAEQLGLSTLLSADLARRGLPEPGSKRFVTQGSSPGTSKLSSGLSKMFPQKIPRTWTPDLSFFYTGDTSSIRRIGRVSSTLGRAAGRLLPVVGAGMALWDIGSTAVCVIKRN